MIPSRKEAKPVILELLSDRNERPSEEIQELIATHFALTDEERARRRGKGPHAEYVNETAWALVELQTDGLITKTDPGAFVYRITDSGCHAAANRTPGTPIAPRRG